MDWPSWFALPGISRTPAPDVAAAAPPPPATPQQSAPQLLPGMPEWPIELPPLAAAPRPRTQLPAPEKRTAVVDPHQVIETALRSEIMVNAFVRPTASDPNTVSVGAATVVEPGYAIVNHVVDDATGILYTQLNDEGVPILHSAKIVGRDRVLDMTLIKLDDESLPPAILAAREPKLGDFIVAIGAPANEQWSANPGFVTNPHADPADGHVCDCVQTNAGLNLGSSGGGIYDADGYLSGMAQSIFPDFHAMGFYIRASELREVIPILKRGDHNPTPFGVELGNPSMPWGLMHHTRNLGGVVVVKVAPNSPAARLGLRPDDRIFTINGERLINHQMASFRLHMIPEGTPLSLAVERDGKVVPIKGIR